MKHLLHIFTVLVLCASVTLGAHAQTTEDTPQQPGEDKQIFQERRATLKERQDRLRSLRGGQGDAPVDGIPYGDDGIVQEGQPVPPKKIGTRSIDEKKYQRTTINKDEMRHRVLDARSDFNQKLEERKVQMQDKKTDAVERVSDRREAVSERRGEIDEAKQARRIEAAEKIKERTTQYLDRIIKRFLAAIERVEQIATRVESRIEKIGEERNVDMSRALVYIDDAYEALANAKQALVAGEDDGVVVILDIETAITNGNNGQEVGIGTEVKSAYNGVKAKLREAQAYIKEAHEALRKAVAVAKEILRSQPGTDEDTTVEQN